ncbi:glycosyltransferase [Hymenobacter aerilatus]|uniref:Glycosyltransferase n=1 Tax=Hymenobacter aerilatus TaxID=2932251 RepID=A0A8T9SQE8_9BACT|nr:glycosyltransferase [Hymenobacter aerilatus]UOR03947.1 glycosyltransferase [Hymenobacter aerilatus]
MSCTVSIVIPCYNHGAYIEETLRSVEQNAGPHPYELIIVDDGSTDPLTLDVMASLQQRGYQVVQQPNQGLAAARNNGIALAQGRYILPLDSDNKVNKHYLTTAVDLLEQDATIDVVYGKVLFFGDGDEIRKIGLREVGQFDFPKMLFANYIDACALIRKSAWSQTGGYDGQMPAMGHEDWEMWINLFLLGSKFHFMDEVGFHYRVLADSMLGTNTEAKHQLNKEYIYRKHSLRIVEWLLKQLAKTDADRKYIEDHKLRSLVKLALGYKIQ